MNVAVLGPEFCVIGLEFCVAGSRVFRGFGSRKLRVHVAGKHDYWLFWRSGG